MQYRKLHDFREIIPLSARKREGLDVLLEKLIRFLPEGPRYFPEDQITDQPVRFMVAESHSGTGLGGDQRRGSVRDHGGDRAV